jgi:hypothetical protein
LPDDHALVVAEHLPELSDAVLRSDYALFWTQLIPVPGYAVPCNRLNTPKICSEYTGLKPMPINVAEQDRQVSVAPGQNADAISVERWRPFSPAHQ